MDHYLCQMISKVEEHQSWIEHECSLLSKLLKPWPQGKSGLDETQNRLTQDEVSVSLETRNVNANENKQEVNLSQADLLALEQANQLLNKARWTRESKSKKSNKDKHASSEQLFTVIPVEEHIIQVKEANYNETLSDSETPQSSRNFSGQDIMSHKIITKSRGSCSVKQSSVHKEPASQTTLFRKTTSRPSSSTLSSRPSSRKSDFVPAHVNAPFKTDVNTRVPNRRLNHLKKNKFTRKPGNNMSAAPKVHQSHPLEATAFKTLPGIKSQSKMRKPDSCPENELVKDFPLDNSPKFSETPNQAIKSSQGSVEPFPEDRLKRISSAEKSGQESFPEEGLMGISSDKKEYHADMDLRMQPEVKLTSLKDHGHDLKIPMKLTRLFTLNNSLLKQCYDTKIYKKVSHTDPAQTFVDRLKSQNEISEELWIRERALICDKAHELMHEILQSLELKTLTEESSYVDIFRTKRKLEFVLLMFGKLQDEAEYFSRVQFRPLASSASEGWGKNSTLDWFGNLLYKDPLKNCQPEVRILQSQLECTKEWVHLKFMEIYCQLHQHLLSLAESEWWQIASCDTSDTSLIQLIHSLMTTNGEHAPAIVNNSPPLRAPS